jgi:hypothetical protein
MKVAFKYRDHDGSIKAAECRVDYDENSPYPDRKFTATNLALFGCGKYASTIPAAIFQLLGGRDVVEWSEILPE